MPGQPRVYLAGPDVFLPDAEDWARRKRDICIRHGLDAVTPMDSPVNEPVSWAVTPRWQRIANRNEAHIRGCDAVVANLTPFRGPSADVGTVYELGFARALGLKVFAYTCTRTPFLQRSMHWIGEAGRIDPDGHCWDGDGLSIEQFGLFDNLMIEGAIAGSGGILVQDDIAGERRWWDLTLFERCVQVAAAQLLLGAQPVEL
jgi:nucleoside 2-deoxyribosyltransferase